MNAKSGPSTTIFITASRLRGISREYTKKSPAVQIHQETGIDISLFIAILSFELCKNVKVMDKVSEYLLKS